MLQEFMVAALILLFFKDIKAANGVIRSFHYSMAPGIPVSTEIAQSVG